MEEQPESFYTRPMDDRCAMQPTAPIWDGISANSIVLRRPRTAAWRREPAGASVSMRSPIRGSSPITGGGHFQMERSDAGSVVSPWRNRSSTTSPCPLLFRSARAANSTSFWVAWKSFRLDRSTSQTVTSFDGPCPRRTPAPMGVEARPRASRGSGRRSRAARGSSPR